ncbi:hypothetical protein HT031_005012 [Scenedesmus sp. PABB004]|nr:hypothetical protein HT031_005012 [Scenedesmus sp. PABB004]
MHAAARPRCAPARGAAPRGSSVGRRCPRAAARDGGGAAQQPQRPPGATTKPRRPGLFGQQAGDGGREAQQQAPRPPDAARPLAEELRRAFEELVAGPQQPPQQGQQQRQRQRPGRAAGAAERAADGERRRLARKARSEAIPAAPSPSADAAIFQALTREWDELATPEERRGARAAARKPARVGPPAGGGAGQLRSVRRALAREAAAGCGAVGAPAPGDGSRAAMAARAAAATAAATAASTPPTAEAAASAAAGVGRTFARAEALPPGEWERLRAAQGAGLAAIKIGRRGASPALIAQVQAAWRRSEVARLAVHDDRASRRANLPRINLLLRELEERSGGVLIAAAGSSAWLYRGPDWVPPPVAPPYRPPPPEELLTRELAPRGAWRELGGIRCYVVGSAEAAGLGAACAVGDAVAVLLLPDQFPLTESDLLLQLADRVAAKGALVVLPDLLGPPPGHAGGAGDHWPPTRWPLVRQREAEYLAWSQAGPGSWAQQRPRLLGLLEAMAAEGLHDPATAQGGAPSGAQAGGDGRGRPLGALGLGWGSHVVLRAGGDAAALGLGLRCVAALSPVTYRADVDLGRALGVPVALLPAKYDAMEQLMLTLELAGPAWLGRCLFKRFGKLKPGWASWLPQWDDERAMFQAAEQLRLAVAWLRRELLGEASDVLPPPQSATEPAAARPAGDGDEGGQPAPADEAASAAA